MSPPENIFSSQSNSLCQLINSTFNASYLINKVVKNDSNKLENNFIAKVNTIEFEGNIKNIYLSINSNLNVRFSVPNAVDTSELETGKNIELTFSSQKAVVLPKGSLAVD